VSVIAKLRGGGDDLAAEDVAPDELRCLLAGICFEADQRTMIGGVFPAECGTPKCKNSGCIRSAVARGFCHSCYTHWMRRPAGELRSAA